jgi:FixJ family two-component response regulator
VEKSGDPGINKQDKNRVVVLIEPDDSVRDALTLLLEGEDWVVRPLPGCEELAEALKVDGIVAVLSESSLPNCTPQEILELCSVNEIPVIFTGHDLPLQGAVDLIRQGAQDFLDKPFPQSRLLDLLQGLN